MRPPKTAQARYLEGETVLHTAAGIEVSYRKYFRHPCLKAGVLRVFFEFVLQGSLKFFRLIGRKSHEASWPFGQKGLSGTLISFSPVAATSTCDTRVRFLNEASAGGSSQD